jgi:hypothetical protein
MRRGGTRDAGLMALCEPVDVSEPPPGALTGAAAGQSCPRAHAPARPLPTHAPVSDGPRLVHLDNRCTWFGEPRSRPAYPE